MFDLGCDQAEGLRRIARRRPVQVIAVTSGKGGVGKTNVAANLAYALAARGREVMLLDADLGLGNVDVLLGLNARRNLSHVVDGECALEDIVVRGPGNIQLVPASSGAIRMLDLPESEQAGLIQAFSDIGTDVDTLVVDTAAGASSQVINFVKACQEIVVVVCDEPTSITDAYAMIKILTARARPRPLSHPREHGPQRQRGAGSLHEARQGERPVPVRVARLHGGGALRRARSHGGATAAGGQRGLPAQPRRACIQETRSSDR